MVLVLLRAFNPIARSLAGVAPWWVVLETTGPVWMFRELPEGGYFLQGLFD